MVVFINSYNHLRAMLLFILLLHKPDNHWLHHLYRDALSGFLWQFKSRHLNLSKGVTATAGILMTQQFLECLLHTVCHQLRCPLPLASPLRSQQPQILAVAVGGPASLHSSPPFLRQSQRVQLYCRLAIRSAQSAHPPSLSKIWWRVEKNKLDN